MRKLMLTAITLLTLLGMHTIGHAQDISMRPATNSELVTTKSNVGFSVKPKFEKHQADDKLAYWWLRVKPAEQIIAHVEIINGAKEHIYRIAANQAVCNRNLTVDYSKHVLTTDEINAASPVDFTKTVAFGTTHKSQVDILVRRNTVADIPIVVDVPRDEFNGITVGGISVTQKVDAQQQTVKNVFNYTVAMVLQENNVKVKPDLKLAKIITKAENGDNLTKVQLINPTNALIKNVQATGTIQDNKGKTISELKLASGTITPQAKFALEFNYQTAKLPAGRYHLVLKLEDADKQIWEFNKIFTIQDKKITEVNGDGQAGTVKRSAHLALPLIIGLLVVGALLTGLGIRLKRK
ncbi:MAG: DUF916 and DUF3324 domain-containing protein [Lactobacillaceae bacterium]|jgi:hypothetical protein|nr:DUF916 and DUF3324 domain-containing protein [Lactobacillaceae bacterium]